MYQSLFNGDVSGELSVLHINYRAYFNNNEFQHSENGKRLLNRHLVCQNVVLIKCL